MKVLPEEGFLEIPYLVKRSHSDLETMKNEFHWKSLGPPEIDDGRLDRKN